MSKLRVNGVELYYEEQGSGSETNVLANHKANDRTADVTVTVTVSCKGEAYDEQATQLMASDLLWRDATSQLSDHYILVGDTVIGTPSNKHSHS